MSDQIASDQILRFIFDNTAVSGKWVQLERSYTETLGNHHYPPAVQRLLGEFLAAVSLLGATLKFEGTISLQARSTGEIPLIMAEATSNHEIRAIVHGAELSISTDFHTLLANGTLGITIDPVGGQRYQGLVALEGDNLAACLEEYFRRSEQLPTRVWLAADAQRAGGLLLQELPGTSGIERKREQWQHLVTLAQTVQADELLQLPAQTLLHRLFHQEDVRLLRSDALQFQCSCSRQRTESMLVSLGRAEIESIIDEQGEVAVTCEFCLQAYRFDAVAARQLFDGGESRH
ncbi:MAG: Hsp33 family molecular chaperone [Verrucomicrobiaceae bacterium]|nr:Hsp33 family molecular chaperone [Verrucomicrobiaceae bacterium]